MKDNLWLFDYNQGEAYEAFSQSEDVFHSINSYLLGNYDFNGKTILEIGAGSGKFTSLLAESCEKLYVVERSKSLMKINQNKNFGKKNTEFILTDVRELNMPPNSIDIIFAGWSLTSMRDSFDVVFENLHGMLREDGIILSIENAGGDEFAKIVGIEEFTSTITKIYIDMGFVIKNNITTTIRLPHKTIFYNAFPDKTDIDLTSLAIQHRVLVLEMTAVNLQNFRRWKNENRRV